MPRGPKGEKRAAEVISNAVKVMRIATGEETDGRDPNAKALGKKGGAALAKNMTPQRRAEIAKKAAAKKWERWQTAFDLQNCRRHSMIDSFVDQKH